MVAVIGHRGAIVYRKAFGWRSLVPVAEPMTLDTVFDVASLTKCLVTATAVMQLVEEGRLRLNDPVAQVIPEFAANGKQDITVRQLLTHFSGLRAGFGYFFSGAVVRQAARLRAGESRETLVSPRRALSLLGY